MDSNGIVLTEQEAEVYDRQIRLWGLESQKRLRSAKILVSGICGLGAEILKNVILSGVKSVTILDSMDVQPDDICCNFFFPTTSIGINRAKASVERAQYLNPMVEIKYDTENLSNKNANYFEEFDIVVILGAKTNEILRINEICRKINVKFFAADLWGMFGFSFADLQEHEFIEDKVKYKEVLLPSGKKRMDKTITPVKCSLSFPSFKAIVDFDPLSKIKQKKDIRYNGLLMLKVLLNFRDEMGRDPSYNLRDNDTKKILEILSNIASDINTSDINFDHIFSQISPAAAIVGGVIAQDIIKTISKKEAPHHNVFIFDPERCSGYIEFIEEVNSKKQLDA